jgi:hypothetical protein
MRTAHTIVNRLERHFDEGELRKQSLRHFKNIYERSNSLALLTRLNS